MASTTSPVLQPIAEHASTTSAVLQPIGEHASTTSPVLQPIAEQQSTTSAVLQPIGEQSARAGHVAAEAALRPAVAELEVTVDERIAGLRRTNHELRRQLRRHELAEDGLRREVARAAALAGVAARLASPLDLSAVLAIACEEAAGALGVAAASITLYDKADDSFATAADFGLPAAHLAAREIVARTAWSQRFFATDTCGVLPDVQALPAFVGGGMLAELDVRSLAICLMQHLGALVGTLSVMSIGQARSFDDDDQALLKALADQSALAIFNARLCATNHSDAELALAYDSTLEGWSRAMDLRDSPTEGHTQRVIEMTLRLARASGVPAVELVHLRRGSLLHDIGKMGVPDSILLKPGKLTEEEWVIMRRHPELAYQMLYPIPFLRPALDIPYCHHEKWDGTGYPRGLEGKEIPLAARLFAVVDIWDALRWDRPYRTAWPEDRVQQHLRALAGTHLDGRLVESFLQLLAEDGVPPRPEPGEQLCRTAGDKR